MTAHERARLAVVEMLNQRIDYQDPVKLEAWIDALVNQVGEIFIDSLIFERRG